MEADTSHTQERDALIDTQRKRFLALKKTTWMPVKELARRITSAEAEARYALAALPGDAATSPRQRRQQGRLLLLEETAGQLVERDGCEVRTVRGVRQIRLRRRGNQPSARCAAHDLVPAHAAPGGGPGTSSPLPQQDVPVPQPDPANSTPVDVAEDTSPELASTVGAETPAEPDIAAAALLPPAPASTQEAVEVPPLADTASWPPLIPVGHHHLPPFPVDVFPDWLADFVSAVAVSTQTPVDLPAMLALSALAAAVARKARVAVKPGYSEPLNVYTVTALPPAHRKSQVCQELTAPLEAYERELIQRHRPVIAKAREQRLLDQLRLKQLRKQAVALDDPDGAAEAETDAVRLAQELAERQPPVSPRLLAEDATPEKLTGLLHQQGGRLAVLAAEGTVFRIMAGRYAGKHDANFDVFLKAHAGDTLRVDRIGRESEFVARPALTLGLTVQPDVLQALGARGDFKGRGLLGRFLYALPESLLGRRAVDAPPVPKGVREEYHRRLRALAELPLPQEDASGAAELLVELSAGAREAWGEFAAWLEPQLAEGGSLSAITDWAGKLAGAVARVAGLLHLAGVGKPDLGTLAEQPVSRETVERAMRVGRYLIAHARQAFDVMGAAEPGQDVARDVLAWVVRGKREAFTRREVCQALKGKYRKPEEVEPGLAWLVGRGYVRERPAAVRVGAGRPAGPAYEVRAGLWEERA